MAIKDYSFELKVLQEAQAAAAEAARKLIAENPGVWYPCGFSWVTIKPARGKLIDAMKHFEVGHTSEEGGFQVYNPSGNPTQWMDAKMVGSQAYVEVLRKHYPDGKLKFKAVERID
jgi:hypothetical protein